jgi:hypothetical protein
MAAQHIKTELSPHSGPSNWAQTQATDEIYMVGISISYVVPSTQSRDRLAHLQDFVALLISTGYGETLHKRTPQIHHSNFCPYLFLPQMQTV